MQETQVELKPCPFCGDDSPILKGKKTDLTDLHIECLGCGVEVRYADCVKSAIELWNKRSLSYHQYELEAHHLLLRCGKIMIYEIEGEIEDPDTWRLT